MKKIQKVVLREARVLSDNEMKHLFGGSGSGSSCTITAPCGASCTATNGTCSFIETEASGAVIGVLCVDSDGNSSVGKC